ncbi:hypothetical protein AC30_3237, partial [Escherichia coli 3-020-07_S3_C2]
MHCVNWRNHAVAAGHQGKGTTIRCSAPRQPVSRTCGG